MKKLQTSDITTTVAMPIKGGTLEFLQLSYREALKALAVNLIGGTDDSLRFFVLYGCVNTGSGLSYIISAGAIYYSGEIYLVPAATFTASGAQVAVGNIVLTQYTSSADPVTFTDGSSKNVHNIYQIVFTAGTAASTLLDFTDLIKTIPNLKGIVTTTMPSSIVLTFDQNQSYFYITAPNSTTITFDFTNAVPGALVRIKWTYGAAKTLTITGAVGQAIIKDSGTLASVASANNLLYLIYLGKNEDLNDEVSYTLKQV